MAEAVIKAKKLTEDQITDKVIKAMSLTSFHKDVIQPFVDEVKFYLKSAGINDAVILSTASVGVFIRGVSDLWNYGSGGASLSPYFKERVIQLSTTTIEVVEEGNANG